MLKVWIPWLCVGLGGLLGSLCRYGLTLATRDVSVSLPYGTLLSNLAGCFAIGAIAQVAAHTEILTPSARLFLATGFCGGFTTLSSLVYELMQMARDGEWAYAALYFGLTMTGAVVAFALGALAVRAVIRI